MLRFAGFDRSTEALNVRQSRAMASVRKPVIVRKFSRDWCAGYAGATFGQDAAELEIAVGAQVSVAKGLAIK